MYFIDPLTGLKDAGLILGVAVHAADQTRALFTQGKTVARNGAPHTPQGLRRPFLTALPRREQHFQMNRHSPEE